MRTLSILDVSQCKSRALAWLLTQQRDDGCFPADFGFRHGAAEAWPTALAVSQLPDSPEKAAAQHYLQSCSSDHPAYGKGWGYNSLTPADADTTFEVWQALLSEGFLPDRDLVQRLRHPSGGFATYTEADAALVYRNSSVAGWTTPHLDITANALRLARAMAKVDSTWRELEEMIAADLVSYIGKHGWRAYWYHSPVVAANMVVRALGEYRSDLPALPLPTSVSALDWEVCHNPHIAASALELALIADPKEYGDVIQSIGTELIRSQKPDGSWQPTLVLSVPYPHEVDPRWTQHVNADYKLPSVSVLRVISALNLLEQHLGT